MNNIKSSIYSNTLAIIKENEMLSEEKLIRLSDAEFNEALKMLRDYGYGSSDNTDPTLFITEGINSLIAFVEEECPFPYLKNFILNQFRYGNAKLIYKSRFTEVNPEAFYNTSDLEALKKADSDRNYETLPLNMQKAFLLLDDISQEKIPSSREIDIVFTKAMNDDNLKAVKKCGRVIKDYYRKKIDLTNFITTFRCRKLGFSEEKCIEMLLTGGYIDFSTFTDLLASTEDIFTEKLQKTGYENLISAADIINLTDTEERVDDYLIALTKKQIIEYSSKEPFFRYFLLQMREFGIIKYLLISLKNGNRERLKGRLKELYDSDR